MFKKPSETFYSIDFTLLRPAQASAVGNAAAPAYQLTDDEIAWLQAGVLGVAKPKPPALVSGRKAKQRRQDKGELRMARWQGQTGSSTHRVKLQRLATEARREHRSLPGRLTKCSSVSGLAKGKSRQSQNGSLHRPDLASLPLPAGRPRCQTDDCRIAAELRQGEPDKRPTRL